MTGAERRDRVMVFIDGQNLLNALRSEWDARLHPVLLGRWLAGDRGLAEIRYYSGVHQRDSNPHVHDLVARRHQLMRRTGVTVVERQLQYHWEWGITDHLPPAHRAGADERHTVEVARVRQAREKGIDLALGLDAVTSALLDKCSTIVVVSRDRDLVEIAKEIDERTRSTAVQVEVALVAERDRRSQHGLDGYDRTHWIDSEVVATCRDSFDYRHELDADEVNAFLQRIERAGDGPLG